MAQKSRGILLLVLVVVLLVVVSSRVAPMRDNIREQPRTTDDPYHEPEPPAAEAEPEVMPEPEPVLSVRESLPGVSVSDWNLKLVNNDYVLPSSFAPNVTEVISGQYFDSRAAESLQQMVYDAQEAGYNIYIVNAYRPYSTQAYIFFGRASQIQWGTDMEMIEAEEKARKVVAYPGTSEHQLGLAVDIMDSPDTVMDSDTAGEIPVLKWLTKHCAEYGFILRYPADKEETTGWNEPWHFRYVGEDCAKYIMDNGLCLEEFIALF